MKPKKKTARVRWRFEDGHSSIPLPDAIAQLQAQYHAMANSDSPSLRAKGRRLLAESAERQASSMISALNLKKKTPTITRRDVQQAQRLHKTRDAQAKHLGISKRHLQRLLKG